ncbi:hypothetical protein BD309DRAFT_824999, partial [Dichomitus squalens]
MVRLLSCLASLSRTVAGAFGSKNAEVNLSDRLEPTPSKSSQDLVLAEPRAKRSSPASLGKDDDKRPLFL